MIDINETLYKMYDFITSYVSMDGGGEEDTNAVVIFRNHDQKGVERIAELFVRWQSVDEFYKDYPMTRDDIGDIVLFKKGRSKIFFVRADIGQWYRQKHFDIILEMW